jgi:hypothetical protein
VTAFPYIVRFGYQEASSIRCATFEMALKVARQKKALHAKDQYKSVSIYNEDRADGDSYGLTEEERAQWEP